MMATLKVQAAAFDALANWGELQEDFAVPVVLGEPARAEIEGVEWCLFDDPAITEEQAIALALEVSGG